MSWTWSDVSAWTVRQHRVTCRQLLVISCNSLSPSTLPGRLPADGTAELALDDRHSRSSFGDSVADKVGVSRTGVRIFVPRDHFTASNSMLRRQRKDLPLTPRPPDSGYSAPTQSKLFDVGVLPSLIPLPELARPEASHSSTDSPRLRDRAPQTPFPFRVQNCPFAIHLGSAV